MVLFSGYESFDVPFASCKAFGTNNHRASLSSTIKRQEIQDVGHMWLPVTETYEQPLNGNQNIELPDEVGYLQHRKLATQLPFDSIYEGATNLAVRR